MRQVSTEILDQTTDCKYEFAFLNGDPNELCEANFVSPDNFVFLKSSSKKPSCNSWSRFGESRICRCPIRVEQLKNNGI